MKVSKTTRWIISGTAGALIVAHGLFPSFAIDLVTVVLVGIAVLPWVTRAVESVELPGGVKITLRDVERAETEIATPLDKPTSKQIKVERKDVVVTPGAAQLQVQTFPPSILVTPVDPNVSLVALRIEIEKRLRCLAKSVEKDQGLPLVQLIQRLRQDGVLDINVAAGLEDLVRLGNSAAHGATVESDVAEWANTRGQNILRKLDELIQNDGGAV